jgi:hypothetical protein
LQPDISFLWGEAVNGESPNSESLAAARLRDRLRRNEAQNPRMIKRSLNRLPQLLPFDYNTSYQSCDVNRFGHVRQHAIDIKLATSVEANNIAKEMF